MTEEQIKQRAERYAETYVSKTAAYIGGAHSRDREINLLRDALQSEQEQSQEHIIELQKEINKLRNPWISVEERPKKSDVYYVRTRQGCADMAYFDSSIEKWEKGRFTDGPVTHWMPITEV